jgi:nucleoside-diphosphate-sugar epimerase
MNVLITGATGFLGHHLARTLVRQGYEVTALTRPTSNVSRLQELGVRVLSCAPDAIDGLADELAGTDAVIHAATCYGRRGESDAEVLRANLLFPVQLFELACRLGVGAFVNLDTCYNTWPIRYKYLESYTLSKRQFAEWGALRAEARRVRFFNLQLQHPYGPGDTAGKFVPFIVADCLAGKEIKLTLGDQRKDFTHIDDVMDAILLLLSRACGLDAGYHHFECGSGKAITVREFVETIHALTGSTSKLHFGALPYREGEIMFSQADTARLCELGWAPRRSLREGIIDILRADHGLESLLPGPNLSATRETEEAAARALALR